MDKDFIPRSCEECIKSKYKRQTPDCPFEQGKAHKKTFLYFKKTYGVEIPQHIDEMKRLQQEKERCLQQVQQQAREMVSLKRGLGIDRLLDMLGTLDDRVNDLEENTDGLDEELRDRILAAPQKSSSEEQTTKKVLHKKQAPEEHEHTEHQKKKLSRAERGWLTYIRNCKKENVKKYVEQLKEEHPEVSDEQIDIGINGSGNRMIRYTLNPDIAKE